MITAAENCDLINTGYDANCTDHGHLYWSMLGEAQLEKSRSVNSALQRERDAECIAATCGAGQRDAGRAGRKFAFSCLAGHDCRRDIARYMPTRFGRRGAARRAEDAVQSCRARARGASPRARCIVPHADEREERERGSEKMEERKREDTATISSPLSFTSLHDFRVSDSIALLRRGFQAFVRRTSVNQLIFL